MGGVGTSLQNRSFPQHQLEESPAMVRISGLAPLASLRLSDRTWAETVFDEGSTSWLQTCSRSMSRVTTLPRFRRRYASTHEFLPGQVNRRALQRDPVASGIDSEVADLEHFFLDAKRPAQERPD